MPSERTGVMKDIANLIIQFLVRKTVDKRRGVFGGPGRKTNEKAQILTNVRFKKGEGKEIEKSSLLPDT